MGDRAGDLELALRYEAGCSAYDELYGEEQEEKFRLVARLVRPRGRVIDVGCGTGLLIDYLLRSGLLDAVELYVCIDVSACMLELARSRARACGSRCSLVQADAYSLPFNDFEFDVAYSVSVVNLLERPQEALKEIGRVAREAVATAPLKLGEPQLPRGWRRAGVAGADVVFLKPQDQSVER